MRKQSGQILPLFAIALILALVLTGIVLDGGLLAMSWWSLQEDADAACIAGATGGDANVALANAGQPAATLTWTDRTLYLEVDKTEPVYLLQLVGINQLSFRVRTRCLVPSAALAPIAVKRAWLAEGLIDTNLEYGVLGQEADQCDDCSGADYAGAVIPNVICVDGSPCKVRAFFGVDEAPSPNVLKAVIEDLIRGNLRTMLNPVGTVVPQISGVSNKSLVKAMADTYDEGDLLIVMIFNGTISDAHPWENLELESYALVEITDLSDVNTLWVKFIKEIDFDEVNLLTRSRTISWTWTET